MNVQLSDAARALWRQLVEEWEMTQYGEVCSDEQYPECEELTLMDLRHRILPQYDEHEDERHAPMLALEEAARGDVRAILALRTYWGLPLLDAPAPMLRELARKAVRDEIGEE